MKKTVLMLTVLLVLSGCAATPTTKAPSGPSEAEVKKIMGQVEVVQEFLGLSERSGLNIGPVSNLEDGGLSEAEVAAMRSALAAGLESRGFLAKGPQPMSARVSLQVREVARGADGAAVKVRMSVEDTHNWNILGRGDFTGNAPKGDMEGAVRSAVEKMLDLIDLKMAAPGA